MLRWYRFVRLLMLLPIVASCSNALGSLLDKKSANKKKSFNKPIAPLKLLAAKEIVKLLQSRYMDTFDKDPQAIIAMLDGVRGDLEVQEYIASKLLRTHKTQIAAKNIALGVLLEKEPEEAGLIFAFSPDGNQLAYVDHGHIRIWNVNTGTLCMHMPLRAGNITAISFDNEGLSLAVGNARGNAYIYALQNGNEEPMQRLIGGHNDRINRLGYHPHGSRLASASDDGTICLWDVITGQFLQWFSTHSLSTLTHIPTFDPIPVHEILGFMEDGGICARTEQHIIIFKGDGSLGKVLYNRWRKTNRSPEDYYIWQLQCDNTLDTYKVLKTVSTSECDISMSAHKRVIAIACNEGIQMYHIPVFNDLVAQLSTIQALYTAQKLKEQEWPLLLKVSSSCMNAIAPLLSNYDAKQEKEEIRYGIYMSLPEELKRVVGNGK